MLEILASIASDGKPQKTNFDRIVYVIESVPNEKREAVLTSLTRFFKSNKVADQKGAEEIKAQISYLFKSHGDFEVHNDVKVSQKQQELLAQQWTKERSEFLSKLEKYVNELEPEWFEDRTVVQRHEGSYSVSLGYEGREPLTDLCLHIPEGAIPGLTSSTNPVTFKAGVMHGTTMQKEVDLLISSLRRKEFSHAECARLADYSKTMISISLGGASIFPVSFTRR